jgi:hypothetical protein
MLVPTEALAEELDSGMELVVFMYIPVELLMLVGIAVPEEGADVMADELDTADVELVAFAK